MKAYQHGQASTRGSREIKSAVKHIPNQLAHNRSFHLRKNTLDQSSPKRDRISGGKLVLGDIQSSY